MERKKICLIGQFPPPLHGLSEALQTLVVGLKNDFDFEIIDIKDNKKILFNLNKIKRSQADLFYFTLSQSKGGNFRDLLILSLIVRKNKKCAVHLHGGYYRDMLENSLGRRQREKNYKAMKKVDGAIVLSPSLKHIFSGMVPSEKIFVVPNCAEKKYVLTEEEMRQKLAGQTSKNVFDVLYLSNFIPEKGYKEVLALAKNEKERFEANAARRFRFHFAGSFFDRKEEKYFNDFIEKENLQSFVTYYGVADGEKKRELLKKCDFFILLTRYPKEGLPISILEAMGGGMAIVSTDHAAIGDMISEGENGVVCKTGEEKNIVALYDRMYELHEKLPEIAMRNREKVIANYSETQYLARLRKIFLEI